MTRSIESGYLDPHHVGKNDEDFTTGFERTSLDRPVKVEDLRRFGEIGVQAHLRVVHGYAITRLRALTLVQLVLRHHNEHRGRFIHEVHDRT